MIPQCYSSSSRVTLVLGNMACDLDSGVSSLVLAYHRSLTSDSLVLPVLNIPRQDYPLKTELVEALQTQGVAESDLVFRSDLEMSKIPNLQLILVDHNILSDEDHDYEDKVTEVIDHHKKETRCENAVIEMVGSCSSLVLRQILKENPGFTDTTSLKLIHSTILIDTVLLDPDAKKVTDVDIEMVEKCEKLIGDVDRKEVFDKLIEAKRKVDHLNAKQLLRRDFKTLRTRESKNVCLSSVPMLAESWSLLESVDDHVQSFMSDGDFSLVMVLGSYFGDDTKKRDFIIIGDDSLTQVVIQALESSTDPELKLAKYENLMNKDFHGFSQGNVAASRKQIMPIAKSVLI